MPYFCIFCKITAGFWALLSFFCPGLYIHICFEVQSKQRIATKKGGFCMELLLDSANLNELADGLRDLPASGVTTNPTILKKEGKVDLPAHLAAVRGLCGPNRSLHVQVVTTAAPAIQAEAQHILNTLGGDTYIKVPVSEAGLTVIGQLVRAGTHVTATAVYTSLQGMLAVLAGANYVAVYCGRIDRAGGSSQAVLHEIADFIHRGGFHTQLLAASFRLPQAIADAFAAGADSVTAAPAVLRAGLSLPCIGEATTAFQTDFETVYGAGATMQRL
jgi:TalC/MipB family fructose-6-phosphate aldolase